MNPERIGEWSYRAGLLCAVVAILYRLLWLGELGPRLYASVQVLPYQLLDLSVLAFLISIASNARRMAMSAPAEGRPPSTEKTA